MRSRGDPAQLQPESHTGTLQVLPGFFFFIFIFSRSGGRRLTFIPVRRDQTGLVLYLLVMDFLKGIAGFAGRQML